MRVPRREVQKIPIEHWRKYHPVGEEYWPRLNLQDEIKKVNGIASRLETAVDPAEVEAGWRNYSRGRSSILKELKRFHALFPEGKRHLRKLDELVWRDAFISIPREKWGMTARPVIMRIKEMEKDLSEVKSSIAFVEGFKALIEEEVELYKFLRNVEGVEEEKKKNGPT